MWNREKNRANKGRSERLLTGEMHEQMLSQALHFTIEVKARKGKALAIFDVGKGTSSALSFSCAIWENSETPRPNLNTYTRN